MQLLQQQQYQERSGHGTFDGSRRTVYTSPLETFVVNCYFFRRTCREKVVFFSTFVIVFLHFVNVAGKCLILVNLWGVSSDLEGKR